MSEVIIIGFGATRLFTLSSPLYRPLLISKFWPLLKDEGTQAHHTAQIKHLHRQNANNPPATNTKKREELQTLLGLTTTIQDTIQELTSMI